jgi:lauroyl/myristoyl acyltransferase
VIIAIAYLLPWAVLVGGITWIARLILRWRKRARAAT